MSLRFRGEEIRNVVLDADDTLFMLPGEYWKSIRAKALAVAGYDSHRIEEMNKRWVKDGLDPDIGWVRAYENYGGRQKDYNEIILTADKTPYLKYDPEIVKLISDLKKQVDKIIVFSGSYYWPVVDGLGVLLGDELRLLPTIDKVVTTDRLESIKPNAQAYIEMMGERKAGIKPENTIFFDDQPIEIKTIARLGMMGVLVGDHLPEIANEVGAVAQIGKINEIMSVFD